MSEESQQQIEAQLEQQMQQLQQEDPQLYQQLETEGQQVAAEARVVTVHWDPGHRKPIPFSAAERTQLTAALTR